jgi:hypothetical protein
MAHQKIQGVTTKVVAPYFVKWQFPAILSGHLLLPEVLLGEPRSKYGHSRGGAEGKVRGSRFYFLNNTVVATTISP